MVKLGMVLIVLCVLVGAGFFCLNSSHPAVEKNACSNSITKNSYIPPYATGPVVYATTDVKEGAEITKDMVVERYVENPSVPQSVARSTKAVLGKRTKFGLTSGQIVCLYDLAPIPKELMEPAVYAIRDVPAGASIQKGDIESVGSQSDSKGTNEITDCSYVIGKKARTGLTVGQRVDEEELAP